MLGDGFMGQQSENCCGGFLVVGVFKQSLTMDIAASHSKPICWYFDSSHTGKVHVGQSVRVLL